MDLMARVEEEEVIENDRPHIANSRGRNIAVKLQNTTLG